MPALKCVNMDVSNVLLRTVQSMVIKIKNISSYEKNGSLKVMVPNLNTLGYEFFNEMIPLQRPVSF